MHPSIYILKLLHDMALIYHILSSVKRWSSYVMPYKHVCVCVCVCVCVFAITATPFNLEL